MRKKVDKNQRGIVAIMRHMGASVLHLHELGKGAPDVLCGWHGTNYLIEIKNGDKPPSAQKLTEDEEIWHDVWKGQVTIIRSVDEAIGFLERR